MNESMLPVPGPDYPPVGQMDDGGAIASSLRLRRLLAFLRRYWWMPVSTLALGLLAETAYVFLKSPTYVSRASLYEPVKVSLPQGGFFSEDVQNFLGTQSELLQSAALRDLAFKFLRSSTNTAAIPTDSDGRPLPVLIRVVGSPKSSVLTILATSSRPLYTHDYLDALTDAYQDYNRTARQKVSGETLDSISEQQKRAETERQTAQDAFNAFQATNRMAEIEQESTFSGSYLAKLKTQLSDLQIEARLLNAGQQEETNTVTAGTNGPARSGDSMDASGLSASIGSLDQQKSFKELEMLKIQRARLSKYLRPKHPKIVQLDSEIEQAERLQQVYLKQNRADVAAALQANQLKMENVIALIKEWEAKVSAANKLMAKADRLKSILDKKQGDYDGLRTLVQNVTISRNIDQEGMTVLESASFAKRTYKQEILGLVLSLFGGIGAGIGLVYLFSVRDDRFTSVNEVNSTFGDAVVGLLPEVAGSGNGPLPLLQLDDPRHIYAEAYRSLRSALMFLPTEGERPKILLVTSAMPNEGKSTVAANLARTLALAGSRVLLVDGDLRKGHIHRQLELQREPGLADLLNLSSDMEKVVQATSLPNLHFIACGKSLGNPGDLFLRSDLNPVFARWRREYDFVLVDSSPLFAVDDASCLAPKVDATLFIVRSNYSSARAVREALDLLTQRQARVLGVVFNGADASSRGYYYYKYAEYHAA